MNPDIEWRVIPNYPDYYISEYGHVYSTHYTRKIMKQPVNNKGYHQVGLSSNGTRTFELVHRLVASAFIPNPENYQVVNHLDLDINNNHFSNLEWCTHRENTRHYYKNTLNRKSFACFEPEELLNIIQYYNKCNNAEEVIRHFDLEVKVSAVYDLVSGRRHSDLTGLVKSKLKNKITEQDVLDILEAFYKLGVSRKTLYEKYGISETQLHRIVKGQRHKKIYEGYFNNLK